MESNSPASTPRLQAPTMQQPKSSIWQRRQQKKDQSKASFMSLKIQNHAATTTAVVTEQSCEKSAKRSHAKSPKRHRDSSIMCDKENKTVQLNVGSAAAVEETKQSIALSTQKRQVFFPSAAESPEPSPFKLKEIFGGHAGPVNKVHGYDSYLHAIINELQKNGPSESSCSKASATSSTPSPWTKILPEQEKPKLKGPKVNKKQRREVSIGSYSSDFGDFMSDDDCDSVNSYNLTTVDKQRHRLNDLRYQSHSHERARANVLKDRLREQSESQGGTPDSLREFN